MALSCAVMMMSSAAFAADGDGDGVDDGIDNCPLVSNADQEDWNGNTVGDSCDQPPGDLTGNGMMNVADALCAVLDVLDPGTPPCMTAQGAVEVDQNCDGSVDVSDVVALITLYITLDCDMVTGACTSGLSADIDADGDGVHDVCEELAAAVCKPHITPALSTLDKWTVSVNNGASWNELPGQFELTGPTTGGATQHLTLIQPLDLSGMTHPFLAFDARSAAGTRRLQVSTDGSSWTNVYAVTANQSAWTYAVADLMSVAGESSVYLRLEFLSTAASQSWAIRELQLLDADGPLPTRAAGSPIGADAVGLWRLGGVEVIDEDTCEWSASSGWTIETEPDLLMTEGFAGARSARMRESVSLVGTSYATLYIDEYFYNLSKQVHFSFDGGLTFSTVANSTGIAPNGVYRERGIPLHDAAGAPLADQVMIRLVASTGYPAHWWHIRGFEIRPRDADVPVTAAPHTFTYSSSDWDGEGTWVYDAVDGWERDDSGWKTEHDSYLEYSVYTGGKVYATYQHQIDISGLTEPTLYFDQYHASPTRTIEYSVDAGQTWVQFMSASGSTPVFRRHEIALYDGGGAFGTNLMFRFSASTGYSAHYWMLRGVRVTEKVHYPAVTPPLTIGAGDVYQEAPETFDSDNLVWDRSGGWQVASSPSYLFYQGGNNIYMYVDLNIDLTGVVEPTLYFWERYVSASKRIDISTDGGQTWATLDSLPYGPVYRSWSTRSVPLYDGGGNFGPQIQLRFYSTTGYTSHYWHLRDLSIRTKDPLPPVVTAGTDEIPMLTDAWELHGEDIWDPVEEEWVTDTTKGWYMYEDRDLLKYHGGTAEYFATLNRRIDISGLTEPTLYLREYAVSPTRKVYYSTDDGASWTELRSEAYGSGTKTLVDVAIPLYDGGGVFGNEIMLRFSGSTNYTSHFWELREIDVREKDSWPAATLDATSGYTLDGADFRLESREVWNGTTMMWESDAAWRVQPDNTLRYQSLQTNDWRYARFQQTVDLSGMGEGHLTLDAEAGSVGLRVEISDDAGETWEVAYEELPPWNSGGSTSIDVDVSTVGGSLATPILVRIGAHSTHAGHWLNVTAMDFYDANPGALVINEVDHFDTGSLESHWTMAVGSHTQSVSGTHLSISDTSVPPETQGWIYDIDCSFGNQMQWSLPIGTGDFTVSADIGYYSSSGFDVFGGMIALVDASNNLVAIAGWNDGSSGGLDGNHVARISDGSCGSGSNHIATTASTINNQSTYTITRTAGQITVDLPGGGQLTAPNTASIAGVAVLTLRHHAGTIYSFGTIEVDRVSVSY